MLIAAPTALGKVDAVEQLAQLRLVRSDLEQARVLPDGLLRLQRPQRVAELPLIPTRSAHLLEGDHPVVPLVEVLERVAQLHQVVLPQSPPVFDPTLFRW